MTHILPTPAPAPAPVDPAAGAPPFGQAPAPVPPAPVPVPPAGDQFGAAPPPLFGAPGHVPPAVSDALDGVRAGALTLQLGSQGPDVATLQFKLNEAGFNAGPLDGIFGQSTIEALANAQGALGLPVTGVADAITVAALDTLAVPAPPAPGGLNVGDVAGHLTPHAPSLPDVNLPPAAGAEEMVFTPVAAEPAQVPTPQQLSEQAFAQDILLQLEKTSQKTAWSEVQEIRG
ncbi:MAG: peptidoglycan-binding domain-containing protein [Acidobacteriota bacterium]